MTREEYNSWLESIGGLESAYRPDMKVYPSGVGDGWLPLLKELIEKLIEAGWDRQVAQVKEKFGTLRFYIGGGTDEIWNIIEEYETKSETICEECGNPGVLRGGGWMKTLCDEHADGREPYEINMIKLKKS